MRPKARGATALAATPERAAHAFSVLPGFLRVKQVQRILAVLVGIRKMG